MDDRSAWHLYVSRLDAEASVCVSGCFHSSCSSTRARRKRQAGRSGYRRLCPSRAASPANIVRLSGGRGEGLAPHSPGTRRPARTEDRLMRVVMTGARGFLGWRTRVCLRALTEHAAISVELAIWDRRWHQRRGRRILLGSHRSRSAARSRGRAQSKRGSSS